MPPQTHWTNSLGVQVRVIPDSFYWQGICFLHAFPLFLPLIRESVLTEMETTKQCQPHSFLHPKSEVGGH